MAEQMGPPLSDEERQRLNGPSIERYGRDWQSLSPEEQSAIYRDFGSDLDLADQFQAIAMDSPGLIRAGNVSAAGASPFTALAQGMAGYQAGKLRREANEGQALGRNAAADLVTRRDYQDGRAEQRRAIDKRIALEKEKERRRLMGR
jgi:hypothetical protein